MEREDAFTYTAEQTVFIVHGDKSGKISVHTGLTGAKLAVHLRAIADDIDRMPHMDPADMPAGETATFEAVLGGPWLETPTDG